MTNLSAGSKAAPERRAEGWWKRLLYAGLKEIDIDRDVSREEVKRVLMEALGDRHTIRYTPSGVRVLRWLGILGTEVEIKYRRNRTIISCDAYTSWFLFVPIFAIILATFGIGLLVWLPLRIAIETNTLAEVKRALSDALETPVAPTGGADV